MSTINSVYRKSFENTGSFFAEPKRMSIFYADMTPDLDEIRNRFSQANAVLDNRAQAVIRCHNNIGCVRTDEWATLRGPTTTPTTHWPRPPRIAANEAGF